MTETGFSGIWLSKLETAGRLHCSPQAAPKVVKAAGIRCQQLPGLKPRYYAPDVDRVAASMVQGGPFTPDMAEAGKRIMAARSEALRRPYKPKPKAKPNGPRAAKPSNAPGTAPDAAKARTAKSTPRAAKPKAHGTPKPKAPTTAPGGQPAAKAKPTPKPATTRRSRAAKGDE